MAWSFLGNDGRTNQQLFQQGRRRRKCKSGRRRPLFEELEARHCLTVFTVTNLSDAAVAPAGSLREAIDLANAAPGVDTINFATGLTGTLSLAAGAGDLDITDSVSINGPGATDLTIDAAAATSRIFNIEATSGDVMLKGMTLANGAAGVGANGGAVYFDSLGMLTISDSVISGNTAGANGGGIFSSGNLIVTNTTIGGASAGAGNTASGSGGGIYSQGTAMLQNSIVSGNAATTGDGGGVYAAGTITVQSSTIGGLTAAEANTAGNRGGGIYTTSLMLNTSTVAGNTATNSGGGIKSTTVIVQNSTVSGNTSNTGDGGGIDGFNVVLRNSTVSGNTAFVATGGGIRAANATLQDSTVANNGTFGTGGGVYASSKLNIQNSIVANNNALTANPDLRTPAAATDTKIKSSLIGDNTDTTLTATGNAAMDANGNFIGDGAAMAISVTDAFGTGGGALGDNGGPTQTIALMTGSIAINNGSNTLAVNPTQGDQRGLPYDRISPFGGVVDMGAFEVQMATAGNTPPVVANPISAQSTKVGNFYSFTFPANTFTDADGDVLNYSATLSGGGALPTWLNFDATSRTFSGTPTAGDVGTITIHLVVSDGKGGSAFTDFDLSVVTNPPPTLDNPIPDRNATVNVPFTFTFAGNTFSDPDGDPLTYSAALTGGGALPAWLAFNSGTRTFSGTPTAGDLGAQSIRVTAMDNHGGTVSDDFTLTVTNSELPFNENFEGPLDLRIKEKSPSFSTTTTDPVNGTSSYLATRPTVGSRPVATVDFDDPTTPPNITNVSVNVSTLPGNGSTVWSNAVIVFDYASTTNYKFAGVFEIINKLIIGDVVNGKVTYRAIRNFNALPNTTIPLQLGINHASGEVTLSSGSTSLSHTFSSLGDGTVGVGTLNANAKFDMLDIS